MTKGITNKEGTSTIDVEALTDLTTEEVTYIEDILKSSADKGDDLDSMLNLCFDCLFDLDEEDFEGEDIDVTDDAVKSEIWYEVFYNTLKDYCVGKRLNSRKLEEYLFAFYKEDEDHPSGTMMDVVDHLADKNIYNHHWSAA